jgi:glutamyl-tRNA reductase
VIVVVGLSHKHAPIDIRERLAIDKDALAGVLAHLTAQRAIGEALVLSTCNRVEIYAAPRRDGGDLSDTAAAVRDVLMAMGGESISHYLTHARGKDAILHLFRVAASLDSLVVGEPQILGQLKEAIELAAEAKVLGATLGTALHRAVRVGKRVRTETAIGEGQASVSTVAVELAEQIFGDLDGRVALLVGAGEMAETAARLLARLGARLIMVNRSRERAEKLALDFGGEPRPWHDLERALVDADIAITSTSSPAFVLPFELVRRVRKARRSRSLFLIDIAVPRDIDPAVHMLDDVYLYDIDNLSQIVAESLQGRAAAASRAEAIVREEAEGFEVWNMERALGPSIVGLRSRTREVLAAEVDRSLSGRLKHLTAADREALRMMIEAATNKLLHIPVTRLKARASDPRVGDYLEALRELFDLPAAGDLPAAADPVETVETVASPAEMSNGCTNGSPVDRAHRQEPAAFEAEPAVAVALRAGGTDELP